MGEDKKPLRIFVSAPAHNPPQQTGVKKLCEAIRNAGCEAVFPDADDPDARLPLLESCDIVLGWTDGLLPEGLQVHAIHGAQKEIQLQFPPEIQGVLDVGWAATQGNNPALRQNKSIILPGQVPEQADSPKGFTLGLGQNGVVCQLASPPINLPEGTVITELGFALGKGIPLLVFAMAPGAGGDYFMPGVSPMVSSFDTLEEALKRVIEADSIKDGLAQILQTNIKELEAMKEEFERAEAERAESGEAGAELSERPS
jgi:nucleoside 2-deoxyribosyltransferase